jgi:transcription antitermination factor NusG
MREDPWHVLQVIANREKCVAQHLAARSLEHYLPLYRARSRWSDRTVVLERPLFPGYVFIRYSPKTQIALMSTPNVLALLGGGEGQTVSGEEIARIREGLAKGHVLRPHSGIAIGSRIRVRSGVFEGVEGVAVEFRGEWKVVLMLAAVQQCFSLELDLDDLEVLREGVNGSRAGRLHTLSPCRTGS